jgi:hypothetical protein
MTIRKENPEKLSSIKISQRVQKRKHPGYVE